MSGAKCAPVARQSSTDMAGFGRIRPDRAVGLYPGKPAVLGCNKRNRYLAARGSNPRGGTYGARSQSGFSAYRASAVVLTPAQRRGRLGFSLERGPLPQPWSVQEALGESALYLRDGT